MTIKLSESAKVIRVLDCKLYGFPLPQTNDLPCGTWIDLAMAAKKYLEPELFDKAVESFVEGASLMTDVDKIVRMIDIAEKREDNELHRAATLIRKHHASILLGPEGYRAALRMDPELALMHIDDLRAKMKDDSEDDSEDDSQGDGEDNEDHEDDKDDKEDNDDNDGEAGDDSEEDEVSDDSEDNDDGEYN